MNNRLQEGWPSRYAPGGEYVLSSDPQYNHQVSQGWSEGGPSPFPSTLNHAFTFSTVATPLAPQILIIDDSATVRKILETWHRRNGFSTATFADGIQALQWVSAHPTLIPKLVYLDIEMPRMDGYDVAHLLHARPSFARVPIVMISGRDGVLDRLKGRLAGARGYMTKPFRGQDILVQTLSYVSLGQSTSQGK